MLKTIKRIVAIGSVIAAVFVLIPAQAKNITLDSNSPTIEVSPYSLSSSLNWAGYYADSGTYTAASGTFNVPSVTNTTTSGNATWIGIGGVKSHDLIQAGVLAMTDSSGSPTYEAWYEVLPDVAQMIPLTVNVGDSVSVSINETSINVWQITITDNTTGKNYSTNVNYDSSESSVEWIEEMPSDQDGFIPLDNFSAASFGNLSATVNGQNENASSLGATPINMINSENQAVAVPSSLSSTGFSVTRTSAASDQNGGGIDERFHGFHRRRVYQSSGTGAAGITGNNSATTTTRVYRVTGQNAAAVYQQIQQLISQQFPGFGIQISVEGNAPQMQDLRNFAAHAFRNFFSR